MKFLLSLSAAVLGIIVLGFAGSVPAGHKQPGSDNDWRWAHIESLFPHTPAMRWATQSQVSTIRMEENCTLR
jgi:hypothetical protein